MRNPIHLFFILIIFLTLQSAAQQKKLHIEKQPAWVTLNNIDYNKTSLDAEAEEGSIDIAFEEQVSVELQTSYYKKTIKIISEAGIQSSSEVSIDFDPSYQQLYLHTINIIREGKDINKLELQKIKVIQQETELSRSLYNGALTAVLFLEDIRKDDVIEYSYSIKGFNPIFKGKYAENFSTVYSVPVYWMYYKLTCANTRNLNIKSIGSNDSYTTSNAAGNKTYEWKFNDVHALHIQDKTPGWYDPFSMIMISEFNSWKEVSDWATALFPPDISLSPGLQKKIESIKTTAPTDEARVLAALRFVQDDVRYLGIELGEHSHLPNNPNKIFDQRFGDCKDKAYLLCTMLHSMGITANPVLINTQYKKAINNWLPSCYDFDHCTVRVILNNNIYFFDATIAYQRGYLQYISFPDYQTGLVLTDTTTALTQIALQESGTVKVKEMFTIPDMDGKAKLVATTVYSGSYADDMRSSFRNNSMYEMQKNFLNFYAGYYNGISVADSMKIDDDETNGVLTTKEYYNIDKLWDNKNGTKKVSFYAYIIASILHKPKDFPRVMPFYITYPAKYTEEITINLPEAWDIEEITTNINTAAYNLKANFTSGKKAVYLDFDYEALKDYVAPQEAEEALAGITKFEDELGYGLSYSSSITAGNENERNTAEADPYLVYTILGVVGFVLVLIFVTQRRK